MAACELSSYDNNGNANDEANSSYPGTKSEEAGVRTIHPTLTLTGHTQTVRCIQFRDNVICSGGSDRVIRVWDIASGTETRTLGGNQGWDGNNVRFGHTHRVSCLQMGPLGNQCLVISGSNDKTACLWDTRLTSAMICQETKDPRQSDTPSAVRQQQTYYRWRRTADSVL